MYSPVWRNFPMLSATGKFVPERTPSPQFFHGIPFWGRKYLASSSLLRFLPFLNLGDAILVEADLLSSLGGSRFKCRLFCIDARPTTSDVDDSRLVSRMLRGFFLPEVKSRLNAMNLSCTSFFLLDETAEPLFSHSAKSYRVRWLGPLCLFTSL